MVIQLWQFLFLIDSVYYAVCLFTDIGVSVSGCDNPVYGFFRLYGYRLLKEHEFVLDLFSESQSYRENVLKPCRQQCSCKNECNDEYCKAVFFKTGQPCDNEHNSRIYASRPPMIALWNSADYSKEKPC